jgi:hypothetical protein
MAAISIEARERWRAGIARLTLRTWLRYLVPLVVAEAIVIAPLGWVARKIVPTSAFATAHSQLVLGWILVGAAFVLQLLLVAAAAPIVKAMAASAPPAQHRALAASLGGLVRGVVPWSVALVAITLGLTALVVPGLVLIPLLALACASDELGEPLPAPLLDGIAVARGHLKAVLVAVAAVIALDVVIGLAAQLALVPTLTAKPSTAALTATHAFVSTVALALLAASPLTACALAATYRRLRG